MKIALVYDRVNKIGGAERILTALHEIFPEAPLFTLVYDATRAPWAKNFTIHTSFLQKIPFAKTYHEFFPVLPIFAFEQFDFSSYDVVISITATEAKGVITSPHTLHISYILTPTRYLWSHYQDYFRNTLVRILSLPLVTFLRVWDVIASHRPDILITISKTSASRILKFYKKNALVLYPPVNIHTFAISKEVEKKPKGEQYFLIVSRLVDYKRVDLAIRVCNELKLPLKIIGDGLAKSALQKLAGTTVEFIGNLTDGQLALYYQNCRAVLFPQEEDFGLVAVEALACGKPVIAYKKGGACEIVQEGTTGEFFYPQTQAALKSAIEKFQEKTYSPRLCMARAELFSKELFQFKMKQLINKEWSRFNRVMKI